MKSFQDFITEISSLDSEHDPGIRSYYSRHGVTAGNREDFETIRKIIMIAMNSGDGRRRLRILLRQLGSIIPEVKPLVNQLSVFNAQDSRDARKLFDPTDVKDSLGGDSDLDGIPDERDIDD